jgi:uncharacterized LabA/DUF88 family protein
MVKNTKNNFAFIDSQNLNVGVQKNKWKMDWKKFRKFLSEEYDVSNAYMFIGYVPEFEPLYEQLHTAGFLIVLKPTFDLTVPQESMNDGAPSDVEMHKDDKHPTKGNVDADLGLWAMKEFSNYNKAVIVSGDGDFYSLVEHLDKRNKLLKLLTPNDFYSSLYNKYKKYVVSLQSKKRELAYRQSKKGQARNGKK